MSRTRRFSLNRAWHYCTGENLKVPEAQILLNDFDPQGWDSVSVPHSYKLTTLTLDDWPDDRYQKTFHRDTSWYRRSFRTSGRADVLSYLEFEGAHQVSDIWVNGIHAGQHAVSGYTPFHIDISHLVSHIEENLLVLRLDNRVNPDVPPDGGPYDFVKFGGLYRSVYLVEKDTLQFEFPWENRDAAIRITTPTVKPRQATIAVQSSVLNRGSSPRDCMLLTRVLDSNGYLVLQMESRDTILPGQRRIFYQTGGVQGEDCHLWSCDNPYLYKIYSEIVEDGNVVDSCLNPLGIRKFELVEGTGFKLNGKNLKLVGGNHHQHYPYVGDAVPPALHRKDARHMKKAGFNVVRLAHYPHNNAFIDACDELGILVYEEAPSWMDFGTDLWMNRHEEAQRRMIRNHRNHPSILIWAAGINHRGPVERLQYAAKEEDPGRWTATSGAQWGGPQSSWCCDIYATMDYESAPYQKEFTFAMEHGGSTDGTRNQQYLNNYYKQPNVFGMTFWTTFDQYTFQTHEGQRRYCTDVHMSDIFRQPRAAWHWYRSELTSIPMVHIRDPWRGEGGVITVFSNCDEVELFIDDKSMERRRPDTDTDKDALNSPPFTYLLPRRDGTLKAVGYVSGKALAEDTRRIPGKPAMLKLEIDLEDRVFTADAADLVLGFAHICDSNGESVTDALCPVDFEISGPATILAAERIYENGTVPVMIQAGSEAGEILLAARSEGLSSAEVAFSSVPAPELNPESSKLQKPLILDYPRIRIDIGGPGQHVQPGWTPWTGTDSRSVLEVDAYGGFQLEILNPLQKSENRKLVWTGECNIAGPLGFVVEDGVFCGGSLDLKISGLPTASYRISTYHHIPSSETDVADATLVSDYSECESSSWYSLYLDNELVSARIKPSQGSRISYGTIRVVHNVLAASRDSHSLRLSADDEWKGVWLNGLEIIRLN